MVATLDGKEIRARRNMNSERNDRRITAKHSTQCTNVSYLLIDHKGPKIEVTNKENQVGGPVD